MLSLRFSHGKETKAGDENNYSSPEKESCYVNNYSAKQSILILIVTFLLFAGKSPSISAGL